MKEDVSPVFDPRSKAIHEYCCGCRRGGKLKNHTADMVKLDVTNCDAEDVCPLWPWRDLSHAE